MLNYWVDFWNNICWRIEAEHFANPFSQRVETRKLLNKYSQQIGSALVAIDGTKFSSNVLNIDASSYDIWDLDFLEQGIDWVIMTWLNDIDKNRYESKNAVWIILWVADCAPIVWSNDDWSVMFNIHWWYKWVLWNWEESNPGIIYSLISQLESQWINPNHISKIHLWPMAWNNFELPLDYYESLIRYISKEYKIIDFKEYFTLNWSINEKNQKLWHLNLKWLVDVLLRYHWVSMYNIEDSWISTTDKNNNWPSYRLHSQWVQEKNNRLSATIAKILV